MGNNFPSMIYVGESDSETACFEDLYANQSVFKLWGNFYCSHVPAALKLTRPVFWQFLKTSVKKSGTQTTLGLNLLFHQQH